MSTAIHSATAAPMYESISAKSLTETADVRYCYTTAAIRA
jgi:hypothetical protein